MATTSVSLRRTGTAALSMDSLPALLVAIVGSLACAWLVIAFDVASLAIVGAWLAVIAIAAVPRLGLLVVFGLSLFFEVASPDPLMAFGTYLHFGVSGTLGISEAILSPLEILILVTAASWLLQGVARRRLAFRTGRLGGAMAFFVVMLIAGLAHGLLEGGDANVALWEARFIAYAVACYYLAANTVRTERHVADVLTVALLATGALAVEGAYRRFALINTGALGVAQEFQYAHEDALILGAGLVLVLTQQLLGAPRWQRVLGIVFLPALVYTMLAAERRAGFVALAVALVALLLVVLAARPRVFVAVVPPLAFGMLLYLAIFWNEGGLLGQPARAIRSVVEPDARDAASNFYRYLETINVRQTIFQDPLFGVGFGRPFNFVVPLPDLSWWPFWHYEPHNSILWVWLKMGVVGFVAFWTLMGNGLARAAHLARRTSGPTRTLATLALCGIAMTLVYSYVDLGIVAGRVTVFVGTLLGTLAVADQTRRETLPASPPKAPGETRRRLVVSIAAADPAP